jgi:MarR family 2-MHQ and catechol resistance regulon transcriptional repressor
MSAATTTMDAARDFRRAMRELVRLQQLRERERTSEYGVTVSGAHALEVLAERGALSLNALAAELFVDKSTACRTVGLLEDRGLVARQADDRDGRAIRVQLTDTGQALEQRLRQDAVWEADALLAALPAEDADSALRLVRELTRTSAAHAGAAPI